MSDVRVPFDPRVAERATLLAEACARLGLSKEVISVDQAARVFIAPREVAAEAGYATV